MRSALRARPLRQPPRQAEDEAADGEAKAGGERRAQIEPGVDVAADDRRGEDADPGPVAGGGAGDHAADVALSDGGALCPQHPDRDPIRPRRRGLQAEHRRLLDGGLPRAHLADARVPDLLAMLGVAGAFLVRVHPCPARPPVQASHIAYLSETLTLDPDPRRSNAPRVRTSDFDYDLPAELVAQVPAEPRDAARLMLVAGETGVLSHHGVRDLPGLLRQGDLLVLNDTRVMAARLIGERVDTGGRVELLLLREQDDCTWSALMRPARAAAAGRGLRFLANDGELGASVVRRQGEAVVVRFDRPIDPSTVGTLPLPPYIRDFRGDPDRYQTVFARDARSAAAPTAGLHFTAELFKRLSEAGIEQAFLTLEVGPATFRPVRSEDPAEHELDPERYRLPAATAQAIDAARADGRRVVAVGTTVVRALEHAFGGSSGDQAEGATDLFIRPGYEFGVVDALLTNFHLPRSTLLMLVSAFAGYEVVRAAYAQAIRERYRFYSFGEAMLLVP